jgi:SAM-dependent methyltransferase
LESLTVTWDHLKHLSNKHFGWHSTHFSRKWEYPWVCSRLAELDILDKTVLDAGAGKSPVALWAANQGAHAITVDSGGQKGQGAGFMNYSWCIPTIASYKTDFSKLDFLADSSLDALTAVSVIEHVSANKRRLAWVEWHRVLTPGGALILTLDLIGPNDRLLNKRERVRIEHNRVHGSLLSIEQELAGVGFTEVGRALCPLTRRHTSRERTTHIVGMVLKKNEN